MEHHTHLPDCQICNGSDFTHYLDLQDYFLTGEPFVIYQCTNCGLLLTYPQPKEQELSRYYQSEDYISHSNKQSDFLSRVYQRVRLYTLTRKVQLIQRYSSGKNILDIGCATGEFLARCKDYGFNVTGAEPDKQSGDYARVNYGIKVYNPLDLSTLEAQSFDVITQWHVLEHVSDLNSRFSLLQKLLKSDGVCLIALPNPASADAAHYKKFWAAYDVPRHLFHFKQPAIKILADKHGFSTIAVLPMKFDAYYISLLSEKYKTGKSNYLKAFFWGFLSNLKAKTNHGEYSSLIYVLKKQNSS
ncbi:MAG: class I SAM-dependent methyltransferase [Lentimicrobiaceae bacterium]|nr:class I SAM-dependent methyltransferase [Lentimicrobiaceae bacterium]